MNPPLIELYNPEQFTATGVTMRNNSFNSEETQHKTLFWISNIAVVEDTSRTHSLTHAHIESSVINLISFGGFSELAPISTPQIFAFVNITFQDLQVEQEENLVLFTEFTSLAHHVFTFSLLQFRNVDFKAGGNFVSFKNSATVHNTITMEHLAFQGNSRGIIELDNLDTDPEMLKRVKILSSRWHQNLVEKSPLISVVGNAELQLHDCTFTENFSFSKGTAIVVKQSHSFAFNTVFEKNYALSGGVLIVQSNGKSDFNNL